MNVERRRLMRLVTGLLLAGALTGCEKAPVLAKGDPAPPFQLETLRGPALSIPDGVTGYPVVVRFWADWCPSCRSEMAVLEKQYQQRKKMGLRVVAVNVGQERATAQRFADEFALTYDMLLDGSSQVARRYGVNALPMTYLIGPDGKIVNKIIGETDEQSLAGQLDRLMDSAAQER
ncbi:MAG: redoxin domain-containing protein [Magnetococcales bacterium]|nr:redoxin domain-containing protein [Magnetococcales bacterium]